MTTPPPSVVVRDVSKRLAGRQVLSEVSMTCAGGQTCAIVGANGSGKSTLLRIVVGLVEPDRGAVEIGGLSAHGPTGGAQRQLGYLPDATDVLPELAVGELIALVRTFKTPLRDDPATFAEWRARLGLEPIWRQRLATLSFGQRKRALLLAALVGTPPLLVLDEPTNGLDGEGHDLVSSLIDQQRREGRATLLATNDIGLARSLNATRFELRASRLAPAGPA